MGGLPTFGLPIGTLGGIAPVPGISYPVQPGQVITLAGVTLPLLGNATASGPASLVAYGQALGQGTNTGVLQTLGPKLGATTIAGVPVPDGWLVLPHSGVGITAAQVNQIIDQAIAQATQTRAAIRLPLGSTTRMTIAVADNTGEIVGLYRMPDSTVFSIGVAVAKARNDAYYNNASELQPVDELPGVAAGFAFTSRTFRYLSEPDFPEGTGPNPGIWSALNDIAVNPLNGLNIGPALPASAYTSMEDFLAFNPQANFHDPNDPLNQNGVVLFPGSSGVYLSLNGLSYLVGGLGVSGDGVNQDDVVTATGITGYTPPLSLEVSNVVFRGVNLPYQNFDRNPTGNLRIKPWQTTAGFCGPLFFGSPYRPEFAPTTVAIAAATTARSPGTLCRPTPKPTQATMSEAAKLWADRVSVLRMEPGESITGAYCLAA